VCREYGPPKVVGVEDVSAPDVAGGQVRVNVHAAAVNFPDVLLVADGYQLRAPLPFVPGSEFAGVVDRAGDGVSAFAPGDRVFGTTFVGAFAEQVTVAAESLAKIPAGVDDAAAAALVEAVAGVRRLPLLKKPGIAESVEWARGAKLLEERGDSWPIALRRSLGLLVKDQDDLARVAAAADDLLAAAR
jgi:D-arabinose 1-dehydrogenase-like Zn-dependent alcohol dehydrogenase